MVTTLALAAALCFALGNVLQQRGTLDTEAGGDDPRFLVQILRKPVWLAGGAAQGLGWILQAVALDRGPLALVQSLTTLSLVLALPLGARFTGQKITRPVVLSALVVTAGIIVFVAVGAPSEGSSTPSAAVALFSILATLALVAMFAVLARRRQGGQRAALLGAAAGFAFGLQAAATKVFVTLVGHGLVGLLTSWSSYVLIVSAVLGFAFQQGGLKTGVLAPAIASSNAVTLLVSVTLGVIVFGEMLGTSTGTRVVAWLGLAAALVGVGRLAATAEPPDEEPSVARAATA
jgi:drug/metabolite transporter (DMT)-like permease